MREGLFIKRNKDRWTQQQANPADNPDDIAREFTELIDDLSYSKTFYPHSKVTQYLNARASQTYMSIYQNKKEDGNRFFAFFKYTVPLTVKKHHDVLLLCTLLFISFFAVGFLSAKTDDGFVREVMGDRYVEMTEENIANGNPFDVYVQGSALLTWLGIMINNLLVAFNYFMQGLLFCFPVVVSLVKEGVRLGAFEYLFFSHGLGLHSVLTVFIHGTLEIAAIIIAAAAGVVIGKSWIFPGTVSRLAAFVAGAREAVTILISLIPVFIVAAFFEGFITRYYNMPVWLSSSILLASAYYLVWYYIIYPNKINKRINAVLADEEFV